MFDFLVLSEGSSLCRLVACVDTLGEAKKLTVIDDCKMELITDRGRWILDRRAYEPPFDLCGFVGVELPAFPGKMALYFDQRIVAAIVKARVRFAFTDESIVFEKGMDIPLFSEIESREIIRREMEGDLWSFGMVASMVTWINEKGLPIPISDYDVGDGIMLGLVSPVGMRDARLLELCLLAKPNSDERKASMPYQYLSKRIEAFLSARYTHNQELMRFLADKSDGENRV